MSSNDDNSVIKDAAEGATKGILTWTLDLIKKIVQEFKDKKIAFIQDEETIKLVKQQYASGESKFYESYIKDHEILVLIRMGLAMRNLSEKSQRRENLRQKIFNKFKSKGLHVVQFTENGLLNRYCGILMDNLTSLEDFTNNLMEVLLNIDNYTLFVQNFDKKRNVVQSSVTKINSHSPHIFIISGISSAAETLRSAENELVSLLPSYDLEKISSKDKENFFFKRKLV